MNFEPNSTGLVPRPPKFFVLQFAFSIIHGSGRALPLPCIILNANRSSASVYFTECKPKNKKWGRPGKEAILQVYLPLSSSPGMTISYLCHDSKRMGGGSPRLNVIMTLIFIV